ncbi:MAG: T9SS type A sorting domain-containing protein [Bacteroidetes bacterium]|nr:T9SS type A sorting domain-containing protein [Bacteroidota bacterium]MBS1740048.1 T9SS type A sorting domain-containing protein [Bacteroidota bacterium]
MKKILLILLFSCCYKFSLAQTVFATDSSNWHFEMTYGSFHCYVAGETMIQGIHAKIIKQIALVKQPYFGWGLQVYGLPTLYVYTASDTTFVYNPTFNRFTPLYIFTAQEGDSICLPLLRAGGGTSYSGPLGDSTFCFVIDSIRMVKYDTATLKTFYTRSYTKTNAIKLNWGTPQRGAYVERIGSVFTGLIPSCSFDSPDASCVSLATDNAQGAGPLRCFRDAANDIKLVINDCENGGISVSIPEDKLSKITISPNPANQHIYVDNLTEKDILKLCLYSSDGRLLRSVSHSNKMEISGLADGIYFLKLYPDKSPIPITSKILIQH